MNEFKLTGRVNFIDIKFLDSGKCFTRVLISEKQKDDTFVSYAVTFFNTKNYNAAEDIAEKIQKGDYIEARGKLNISKFTDKYGQNREQIELIGFDFNKVQWDETARKYVAVKEENCIENDEYATVERTPIDYEAETKLAEEMLGTPAQTVPVSKITRGTQQKLVQQAPRVVIEY